VEVQKPAQANVPVLLRLKIVEFFSFRQLLRAIETLAALAAAVWTIREKQQDPKFQNASSLGAMDMVTATEGTISILGIYKEAEYAFHSLRMILPDATVRNHPLAYRTEMVISRIRMKRGPASSGA
jgi:hypothetical protein